MIRLFRSVPLAEAERNARIFKSIKEGQEQELGNGVSSSVCLRRTEFGIVAEKRFACPNPYDVCDQELQVAFHLRSSGSEAFPYMVQCHHRLAVQMPFYAAGTLEQVIGHLTIDQALSLALLIGTALAESHTKGVVLRDLKPSNIMLSDFGVVLIDFGFSKFLDDNLNIYTTNGRYIGTPAYSAPETFYQHQYSAASDMFSYGVVIYQLFSGRRPFPSLDAKEVTDQIISSTHVSLTNPYSNIIDKCLSKNPAERPTAAEVVSELKEIAKRSGHIPPLAMVTKDPADDCGDLFFDHSDYVFFNKEHLRRWKLEMGIENIGGLSFFIPTAAPFDRVPLLLH